MKITLTYYSSDILDDILFLTEHDAKNFDAALENFLSDTRATDKFTKVISHYTSVESARRSIDSGEFQFGLIGNDRADELFLSCEKIVADKSELINTRMNIYKKPLNYIFEKILLS